MTHTNNPPTLALKSLRPDTVAAWVERDKQSVEDFNKRLEALSKELGSPLLMVRSGYDGMHVTGFESTDPKRTPPAGWRRERNKRGSFVPALRSNAGKRVQERLDAMAHRREDLPGLPGLVWGEGYLGTWRIAEHGGDWYATITTPLGERTPKQTGLSEVDGTAWTEVPLSEYWRAREAEEAKQ